MKENPHFTRDEETVYMMIVAWALLMFAAFFFSQINSNFLFSDAYYLDEKSFHALWAREIINVLSKASILRTESTKLTNLVRSSEMI